MVEERKRKVGSKRGDEYEIYPHSTPITRVDALLEIREAYEKSMFWD
jgi:hypothetical protein